MMMLKCVEWACWWCCCAGVEELSLAGTVNLAQKALSCAWGLGSLGWLAWILFCGWSPHCSFGSCALLCNGEYNGATLVLGVDCMLGQVSLGITLCSSVIGFGGRACCSCRPRSRLVISAMTLQAWVWCCGRYLIRYPSVFSMGLTAWKSGWAGWFPIVKEAVNICNVA